MAGRPRFLISIVLVCFPLLISNLTMAQLSVPILNFGFRQNYNSYTWKANLNYKTNFNTRKSLLIQNRYTSNLLRISPLQEKWRDDTQFQILYKQPLWRAFDQIYLGESNVFIDKQTGYANSATTHLLAWGIQTTLLGKLQFKSRFGEKWDKRQGQQDRGFYHQASLRLNPTLWQGYLNRFQLNWRGNKLGRRRNYDFLMTYKIAKEFYPGTLDSLMFQMNNNRRDYYISTNGDLESRREQNRRLLNRLVYPVSRHLQLRQFSDFYTRTTFISQILNAGTGGQRNREDTGMHTESELFFRKNRLRTSLGLIYTVQSETYTFSKSIRANPFSGLLGMPDNKSSLFEIRSNFSFAPGSRDRLVFQNSVSRLRYDTPDTLNFDDRDELRTIHLLQWTHFFESGPEFKMGGNVRLRHLVYIYSERSAENNWNRIFNLYSSLKINKSPRFEFKQRAEILANYTDYDFEYQLQQVKSYVFRELAITDSLRWNVFGKTNLMGFYRLEMEENGRLFWDTFAEQPLISRHNHYFSLQVDFPLIRRLRTSVGFQSYFRREWPYKMVRNQIQKSSHSKLFQSYGPVFKIYLLDHNRHLGLISITTLRVQNNEEKPYFINQIHLQARWYF